MPKVPVPPNDALGTVKSVPIDIANIAAIITATVMKSTSKVNTIATISPKIHLFTMLAENPSAGVDVDVVKLKW